MIDSELQDQTVDELDTSCTGETRRTLLRTSLGGLALATSGLLLLPSRPEIAEARKGALDGAHGGRHGKNRRGRNNRRNNGNTKKNRHDNAPRGGGLFRSTALKISNSTTSPLECTFYYRIKSGLDSYGGWVQANTETINGKTSFRYAPERFRVGALLKAGTGPAQQQIFVDVRNLAFDFPKGSVTRGASPLNPPSNNVGDVTVFTESTYSVGQSRRGSCSFFFAEAPTFFDLARQQDSEDHIEFELMM